MRVRLGRRGVNAAASCPPSHPKRAAPTRGDLLDYDGTLADCLAWKVHLEPKDVALAVDIFLEEDVTTR